MDSKILKALGIDPALIFLFLLVLIVILFVLYVNVTMKYNRLKSSYTTFMRGKDGKTLEESMIVRIFGCRSNSEIHEAESYRHPEAEQEDGEVLPEGWYCQV